LPQAEAFDTSCDKVCNETKKAAFWRTFAQKKRFFARERHEIYFDPHEN
jgi:hypothetical protein